MKSTELLSLRLVERRHEAHDILALQFESADGGELPPFEAGAHIDLTLPNGLIRPYSLCNDPSERSRYVLGVLRDPQSRGGSRALHDQVAVGDILPAGQPRNLFPLVPDAGKSILIAGGIGITPLLAMAQVLAGRDSAFELHYATRSRERTAFRSRLAESDIAAHTRIYHDDGEPGQRFAAAQALRTPKADTHLYVCGPAGFIQHVVATARSQGWPTQQIHTESFSPINAAADASKDRPFDIVLASTGAVLHVAAGRSVVQALAENGVAPPVSCEQGICGTCATTVLEGQVDHRDAYLTPADRERGDCFMPCCSRALSDRLVLDL